MPAVIACDATTQFGLRMRAVLMTVDGVDASIDKLCCFIGVGVACANGVVMNQCHLSLDDTGDLMMQVMPASRFAEPRADWRGSWCRLMRGLLYMPGVQRQTCHRNNQYLLPSSLLPSLTGQSV
jgi:hypothetical protein